MIAAYYALCAFGLVYALWLFFLAVMALKHARDAGRLSVWGERLGWPILLLGYLLDFVVNVLVLTILLLELPHEWLVTARVSRHIPQAGYRGAVARWLNDQLLEPIDPGHCK